MMRTLLSRLRALFRRDQLDADLDGEVREHLELLAADYRRRGLTVDEARHAARRAFGAAEPMKEIYREGRGFRWIDDVRQDVRYGLRGLRRNPGFALVAIVTLALGIGANSAIFSLLDAVLLRPLPVTSPHELVMPRLQSGSLRVRVFTTNQFIGLRDTRGALTELAAFRPLTLRVHLQGESDLIPGQLVSGAYHAVLGVEMLLGRGVTEADDRNTDGAPVVVISHGFWQRRFGGDRTALGQTIEIEGRLFTIVGVTAREFFGTQPGRMVDITVPLAAQSLLYRTGRLTGMPADARALYLIGRLAPGVSPERASAALAVTFDQLRPPPTPSNRPPTTFRLSMADGSQGLNDLRDRFSMPLRVLMAMVGLVLAVACANLAMLLLARAGARRHEIGLRLAIGASRGRLLRQLLTESLLLSALGGAAGVAVAVVAGDVLVQIMSRGANPIEIALEPNARTLLFTLAVTIVAAVGFGIGPSLRSARQDVISAARTTATMGGRTYWSRATIAAQVALCVVLLVEAGLFARSLTSLRALDTGFEDGRTLVSMFVRPARGDGQPARASGLLRELYGHLAELGLQSATFVMDAPLGGDVSYTAPIAVAGVSTTDEGPSVHHNFVGPRFFETMRIPLRGRDFRVEDDQRSPKVAVISESVARSYFPGVNPIGRHIRAARDEFEIIGVGRDVRYTNMRDAPPLTLYLPYFQSRAAEGPGGLILALRTVSSESDVIAGLRRAVRAMARDVIIADFRTLEERMDASLVRERVVAVLASVFGGLALLLGCVGLYGTLAYGVLQRTAEFGVRTALGANAPALVRMVIGESLRPVAAGIIVGLPLAFVAGQVSQSLLFGVTGADPATYAVAATMLLVSAAVAAFVPALGAAGVDPVIALRSE
jgi:predicted permease